MQERGQRSDDGVVEPQRGSLQASSGGDQRAVPTMAASPWLEEAEEAGDGGGLQIAAASQVCIIIRPLLLKHLFYSNISAMLLHALP